MKTRVYKIRFEPSIYQRFYPDDPSRYQNSGLRFEGKRRGSSWQPLDVYVLHPLREVPDIWQLSASGCELIVDPTVAATLAYPLQVSGELLPVLHEGNDYLLFNCTEVINCLDQKKTEFRRKTEDGRGIGPVKYAFHPNRFTTPIFKIPEELNSGLFALEWSLDPQKELKAAVEHHKLKGIRFEPVWEDSG